MKKSILYIMLIGYILLNAFTCQFDIDVLDPPLQEDIHLKGDWIVKAYVDGKEIFGPFSITTQPTNDNNSIIGNLMNEYNSITINDAESFWKFQVNASADISNNSFSAKSSNNQLSKLGTKINILNGVVDGKDNISFDIQFEDDETPFGITYNIKGKRAQ